MISDEIKQIILAHKPNDTWIKWAAFDEKNSCSDKICFYEYKPKLRSSYWFSDRGRTCSIYVAMRLHYDWSDSLISVKVSEKDVEIFEKEEKRKMLQNKINEMQRELDALKLDIWLCGVKNRNENVE